MIRTRSYKLGYPLLLSMLMVAIVVAGCGGGEGCGGPTLNTARLLAIRGSSFQASGAPMAGLIIPNPIEATQSGTVSATDSRLFSFASGIALPGLLNSSRLENNFLRVRIREINDPVNSLATPNSKGAFAFNLQDVKYSETMGYYGVQSMIEYVEALGFSVAKSRPLFVMVRAATSDPNEINAIYDHHYLDPNSPRTMRLFGETEFAPGMDRDMYWHEFGHLFNESASREVGMDFAGDNGAIFTEGAAMHECLADILAESVGDSPNIGRWIARNLSGFRPGEPLRTAVDPAGSRTMFNDVIIADSNNPERYAVAEWCTRLLWEIREDFVAEDSEIGAINFERMLFSAVSLLERDASIGDLRSAMVSADDKLHCGGHETSIETAFQSRGFIADPPTLSNRLEVQAEPTGVRFTNNSSIEVIDPTPGQSVVFAMRIRNNNSQVARNVRVKLEPLDQGLLTSTYLQGYGDLAPGQTIQIGLQGLDFGFSVFGEVDQRVSSGSRLRYQLRIMVENGPETVVPGEITL